MATLNFIPNNLVKDYLGYCWAVDPALSVTSHGSYNVTITDLTSGSQVAQTEFGIPVVLDLLNFEALNNAIQHLLFQFGGFCAFTIIFGLSLIASFISLHYLFKNWRKEASHMVVTGFTILLSAFNIAIFVLRALAMASNIRNVICPGYSRGGLAFAFESNLPFAYFVNPHYPGQKRATSLTLALIPIFLWISDAFLIYRAWVIWVYHRKYTAVPAVAFLVSLAIGIVWLNQTSRDGDRSESFLEETVFRWIPALGFSCGLDAITTGMIAGRLIYHHWKQKKLAYSRSTIYLPVVTIFIESAALSLISKILQISVQSLRNNPIVVPLCTISSNLIVLRKALGADVGQVLAKGNQDLSALRFHLPSKPNTNTNGGDIPGGFESHLIQTIGGRIIDFGPLGQAETLVPRQEVQDLHQIEAQSAAEARSSFQLPPNSSASGSSICPRCAASDRDSTVSSLASI